MPEQTSIIQRQIVLPETSISPTSLVPDESSLSQEDKMILYAVLQDLANELRRIDHECQKHNQKREPVH